MTSTTNNADTPPRRPTTSLSLVSSRSRSDDPGRPGSSWPPHWSPPSSACGSTGILAAAALERRRALKRTLPPAELGFLRCARRGSTATTTTAAGGSSATTTTRGRRSHDDHGRRRRHHDETAAGGSSTTATTPTTAAAGPARVLLTSPQLTGQLDQHAVHDDGRRVEHRLGVPVRPRPGRRSVVPGVRDSVRVGSHGTPAISETGPSGQSVTSQSSLGAQTLVVQAPASCTWVVKVTGS